MGMSLFPQVPSRVISGRPHSPSSVEALKIRWIAVSGATVLVQLMLINNYYSRDVHLTFWDIYPWLVSFPECVVVVLFSFKLPLGSKQIWRLFLIPYFLFIVVSVWEIVDAYIQLSHLGVAYKLPAVFLLAIKGFDIYAVINYGRDGYIWRRQY